MKKFVIIKFVVILFFITNGCIIKEQITSNSTNIKSTDFPESTGQMESNEMNNNCKLIIRGKEISTDYACIYHNETETLSIASVEAAIPLITVVRELGARVEKCNENNTVIIEFDEKYYTLDLSSPDFGIPQPPGQKRWVRTIIADEIIIDDTSARGIIRWLGAQINISFNDKIINIE